MGSFSLGNNFQYSRYDFSGYDRVGISSGIRLPLSRSLTYDLNFRQNWVKNVASGDKNRPYVFTTGLNYYKNISKQLTLNLDLSYRDEENTAGKYSFLGGEDNVEFSAGIDYMPVEDVTLFLDTRLRNVWAEEADRDAYHELDVRWGLRSSWDLPFSWSPQAQVDGFIFNDLDGDGIKDESEEGIEGAKIRVGKKEVISQQDGRYQGKFSAERIIISVKPDSLPSGYVFTTPMSRQIKVKHNEVYRINFGFNTQSSIYGVVYDDKNNNQKPDVEDEFISGVNVNLDNGKEVVRTDFEGAYYFRDIEPGEHLITVDINSLPSGYLPGVKVKKKAVLSEGATYIYHIPLKREPQ
jgi:hypothetical protein